MVFPVFTAGDARHALSSFRQKGSMSTSRKNIRVASSAANARQRSFGHTSLGCRPCGLQRSILIAAWPSNQYPIQIVWWFRSVG